VSAGAVSQDRLLKEVSRSFYLTLRVLPRPIRGQIGLAYLLARTTDTIADTGLVPLDQRLDALQKLRQRILGNGATPLDFAELANKQGSPSEQYLLEHSEDALAALAALGGEDKKLAREVLDIITSGQELDLTRFKEGDSENIIALQTDAEMDDYTYRVAGCVGEFWTKMCPLHLFARDNLDSRFLLETGVRYGKGLQMVNILRDLPNDLRSGRCYVPANALADAGLLPADLLEPENESRFRPVYNRYLAQAEAHLAAGWAYTNALPGRCWKVRLACAWPILIGIKTLEKLRNGNVLDPYSRIKVSRGQVKWLMFKSVVLYPFPRAWPNLGPRA
jgi:farnesyl-diphosphate farnesyltransferase